MMKTMNWQVVESQLYKLDHPVVLILCFCNLDQSEAMIFYNCFNYTGEVTFL